MNIAANPIIEADQTVYLKDYQKPSFLVDSIHLDICLLYTSDAADE